MTGFSRLESSEGDVEIVWQLKSVNHRYLEIHFRLPDGLGDLEGMARKRLQAFFSRGHLDCSLALRRGNGTGGTMVLDEALLEELLSMEGRLRTRLDGRGAGLSLGKLLSWPGVVRQAQGSGWSEPVTPALLEILLLHLEKAARELEATRRREGELLTELLQKQLSDLAVLVEQVENRLPTVRSELECRLRQRLAELGETGADPVRLSQEIVFYLHRMDVAEELDRLKVHIREMKAILEQGGPVGRRLDFLCQELHREANTLGSKSQDGQLTRLGVDMKVAIEKLREQIQNLE
ncbi:MAG: YicC family protein [Magnetococcales bacterium]|nr:YicC family protein [Magnetococcales bacterium]MBF0322842.1 YicC family protein [Magnetococcales bacterium]